MKLIHLAIIFAISCILSAVLFYVDEATYSFKFLVDSQEFRNWMISSVLFSVIPVVLWVIFGSTRLRQRSIHLAMIGYLPPLAIIVWAIGF